MVRGKHKNISNKNQGHLTSSELNSSTIASGYTVTAEKQDSDLKSLQMMMMEVIKKDITPLKKYRRKQVNSWKPLMRKHKNKLRNYRKTLSNR